MNERNKIIYLNNAATSYPKALGVPEAVDNALRTVPGAANRGGIEDFDVLTEVRKELGTLLGVSTPQQIGLGPHATWALNVGIHGLGLQKGDVVLTSVAEHNSVLRPLHALSVERGVEVHHLHVNDVGRMDVDEWRKALQRLSPRLCVITHASNVTGAINDLGILTKLAHNHEAVMLADLSQTAGCVPIALEEWDVDLAAFTGHKYLLGPQGTGGLYVKPGIELTPYLTGGTGIHSDLDVMPPTMPLHLEAGTNNEPGFYGLLQALKWQRVDPFSPFEMADLLTLLKEGLGNLGAQVIDPSRDSSPVVSFTVKGFTPQYLGDTLLDSYDIVVRTGLHCAPRIFEFLGVDPKSGTVRVSLSRFTTTTDIEDLLQALHEIVAAGM